MIAGFTLAASASGFSNYSVGEVLPDRTLTPLSGGKKLSWLGKAKVNVFFFFTPGTKHSKLGLKELAELEKELAEKPVAIVGLVSSNVPAAEAKKDLAELGLTSPVLIDEGDAIYGMLGTALTPVVGITDEKHKLIAYLPFNKLQYQDKIRAWIRFGLGELTEEQLKTSLTPPPAIDGGELTRAHRYLNLATRQQKAGNIDSALGAARKSLEHAELAGAHAILGRLLATKGSCAEAAQERARALELEPENEEAKGPLAGCGGGGEAAVLADRRGAEGPGLDGGGSEAAGSAPSSAEGSGGDGGPVDGAAADGGAIDGGPVDGGAADAGRPRRGAKRRRDGGR